MDTNTAVMVCGVLTLLVLVIALVKIGALSKVVARLSDQIPGTGMTAKELATELGGAIETSFQKYMPQPEKMAGAISSSLEQAVKKTSADVEGLHKKLLEGQDAVLSKWVAHEKSAGAGLEAISKAMEVANQQLASGLSGGSQKMQASLDDGSKKLAESLGSLATKLETTLKDHAEKTAAASAQLSAQLDMISALGKDIEKLLHLQQSTDGTMKSVAASEEFKDLVKALRSHLETSDNLLREVAKPRTIRLVEQES